MVNFSSVKTSLNNEISHKLDNEEIIPGYSFFHTNLIENGFRDF
jgi:hypothetical protein